MDPLTMGLITGGANLLGSIFSSSTSASNTQAQIAAQQQMQQQSQQFNAEQAGISRDWGAGQAQVQRDYQTQMSNSAFQRSRQDAMAAGLNPMVLAGMGGASTPSGASAAGATASTGTPTAPTPQNKHPLEGIGDAVGKAVNSAVAVKTYDKMTEEIANLKVTNDKLIAETGTELERAKNVAAQTKTEQQKPENVAQHTTALKLDRARQEWEAIKYLDLSSIPDAARKTGNIGAWGGKQMSDVLAPISSSARSFLPRVVKKSGLREDSKGGWSTFDEMHKSRIGF